MKICLLLQRRFAYLGHQLAIDLKNRYGINEFCGYVYVRSGYDFLRSQADINYSSLLLDEEIHKQYKVEKLDLEYLKELEREYGIPNLWPYIEIDRVIRHSQLIREFPFDQCKYTHEELMRMVQVRAKAIIGMLKKEKPDYLIISVAGGMGSLLLYQIAKKMGVKLLFINVSRVAGSYLVSEHYSLFPEIKNHVEALASDRRKPLLHDAAKKYLKEFQNNPKYGYADINELLRGENRLKQLDFLRPKKALKYFSWLAQEIRMLLVLKDRNDFSYVNPFYKILDQFRRKFRNVIGINDLYDSVDTNEDFVFFPLHVEPEITLSLYAPFYTDQLYVISQVAKSLPLNFKLYVKDHPGMAQFRTRSFFRKLKKIPNVKLIRPNISSFALIPCAKLIAVITSTVGWEAVLLKKPVITFGDIFFNHLSMVKKCHSYEELPQLVAKQLNDFRYDETELISWIAAIMEESVNVNLARLWFYENDENIIRDQIKPLTDLLAKKMDLINKK